MRLAHVTLAPSRGDEEIAVGLREISGEDLVVRVRLRPAESFSSRVARCRAAIEEALAQRDQQLA